MAGFPTRQYAAIYADPPWRFQCWSGKGTDRAAENHYPTMTIEDIMALPVETIAADDCVLFIWIVWPMLPEALEVIKAWGFAYKTCGFSWMKGDPYCLFSDDTTPDMGMGYWTRANSEVCLLATRGKPKRLDAGVRQGIISPRREHSRKPDDIYGRIERLVSGPYIELFSRTTRKGWDVWGKDVDTFGGVE